MLWTRLWRRTAAALLLIAAMLPGASATPARAHDGGDPLTDVAFEQKLNAAVPAELNFVDENGQRVTLGAYLGRTPVVLVLAYYDCPMLCSLVLNDLAARLREISLTPGEEFEVVIASIDPGETPELAKEKEEVYLAAYGRPETAGGWHFLTGEHEAIDRLADAVGFQYAYLPERDEYAHPSGVMVLTPEGRIARYFFGFDYPAKDLRLGIVEASREQIASPVDRLFLLCYAYDPVSGQYTLLVQNLMRLVGLGTALMLGGLVLLLLHRERTGPRTPRLVE